MNHSQTNNEGSRYVLITAAHNEQAYIEQTLKSVVAQTVLPQKWVIVSDGSTDRTDEIVKLYEDRHDYIELLHRETNAGRNFASKVDAIQAGFSRLNHAQYDFVGNLDADVVLETSYYEVILAKFQANPNLGMAGGLVCNRYWDKLDEKFTAGDSVRGSVQMFRRECYEQVGGYTGMSIGGEDTVAEIKARMHGWQVKTFPDIKALHLRPTGTAESGVLRARFRQGKIEYRLRYHPLFEVVKCLWRIRQKPYLLGSIFRLSGYCWSLWHREQPVLPNDVMSYLRCEQLGKLKAIFKCK